MHTVRTGLCVVCAWMTCTAPAHEILYHVTPLGDFPGGQHYSDAADINSQGQVTGVSAGDAYQGAFRWSPDEGMLNLGYLPGGTRVSTGCAINELGHVAGVGLANLDNEAFLWTPEGGVVGLGDLPGGIFYSWGKGINDFDQICGDGSSANGHEAFFWDADLGMIPLGDLPGGQFSSYARDINNAGQITGWSIAPRSQWTGEAFLWDLDNGIRPLPDLPDGGYAMWGDRINERGQISGVATTGKGWRAFVWDPHEGYTLIGKGRPYGLNNRGEVAGGGLGGAMVWDRTRGMRRLDDLVDARTPRDYFPIYVALGLNDAGQVIAQASHFQEALLLTPFTLADMDCDGSVNALDIAAFALYLEDPDKHAGEHPGCRGDWAGDANQDGSVNGFDIATLLECVLAGGCPPPPRKPDLIVVDEQPVVTALPDGTYRVRAKIREERGAPVLESFLVRGRLGWPPIEEAWTLVPPMEGGSLMEVDLILTRDPAGMDFLVNVDARNWIWEIEELNNESRSWRL